MLAACQNFIANVTVSTGACNFFKVDQNNSDHPLLLGSWQAKQNDTACLESRKIGRNYTKADTKIGKGQREEKPFGCLMNELLF